LREKYGGFRGPEGGSMVAELEALLKLEERETETPLEILESRHLDRFKIWWENEWEDYQEGLCHPSRKYIFDRGFHFLTCKEFKLGYDAFTKRITIPVTNEAGKLVGFKGRAWEPEKVPRYLILGDRRDTNHYGFSPYPASKVVFGIDRLARTKLERCAILCEGELNPIMLRSYGVTSAIGISGSWLSEYQAKLIKKYVDEVVLFFDSDKAGQEGAKRVIQLLEPDIDVRVVPDHEGDPASLTRDESIRLIAHSKPSYTVEIEREISSAKV
jgi:DNA primase